MKYTFSELVDLEKVQSLMDSYCQAIGIASALIDLDGQVLVSSNWQRLCTDFHRVNEQTCKMCLESDTVLANRLGEGERYTFYECRNGLLDAATPVLIDGEHMLNLFIGQFLSETPKIEFFQKQAARFDFDVTAYMAALAEVPVISRQRVESALHFVSEFAVLLGEMGLKQKRQLEQAEQLQAEIAERQHIEVALRESEARYGAVVEQAMDGVLIIQDNVCQFVNKALADMLGYRPAEMVGSPFINYIAPESRALIAGRVKARLAGEEVPSLYEARLLCKDGAIKEAELSAGIIQYQGRRADVGVIRDITGRKRAEEALHESTERFRALVETLSDWIWEVDAQGSYTYASPRVKELLGYEVEEIVGKTPFDLMPPEEASRVAAIFGPLLAEGKPLPALENTNRHKDGHLVVLETNGVPFFDREGNLRGYRGVDRDVTDRKELEQQLRESLERRRRQVQLATWVAQDIGTVTNLADLYRRVVSQVNEQFGYYQVQLLRYDPTAEAVGLVAGSGQVGEQMLAQGHRLALGQGLAGTAAAIGSSLLASDVRTDPDWLPNPLLPATRGELAIPITLGQENSEAQVLALKQFTRGNFDGWAVCALNAAAVTPVVQEALRRGLPVATITHDLGEQNQTILVAAAEYELGYMLGRQAGDWAARHVPTGEALKVGVLNYRIIPQVIERERGILEGLKAVFAGEVEIVGSETASDPIRGLSIAERWLQFQPDLKMIVGINDGGALGAYQAVAAAGKDDPDAFFVGGIDAVPEALTAIKAGGAYQATVNQPAAAMGIQVVRSLAAVIKGLPYEPRTLIKCAPVNRSNLAEFLARDPLSLDVDQPAADVLAGLDLHDLRLGLSVLSLTNPFFAALAEGAQAEAARLGLQLVTNDPRQLLGVLDVQSDRAGALSAEDQLALEGLCSQVAMAIESTRLRQEMEENLRELRAMQGAMRREGWASLRQAGQLPGGYLFDRTTLLPADDLWLPAIARAVADKTLARPETVVSGHDTTGQPAAVAPMLVQDETVGVLGVYEDPQRPLSPDDLALLASVSDQVAVALESARLFEQTQSALAETELLYRASAELNMARDYDEILAILRRHILSDQEMQSISLNYFDRPWTADQKPAWIEVLAYDTRREGVTVTLRYALADFLSADQLLRSDALTVVQDVATDPRMDENVRALYLHQFGAKSTIFAPLVVGGQWLGYINAFYQHPVDLPESEMRRLLTLAGQAAVATQTVYLVAQMQEALAETQALYHFGEVVSGQVDLQAVYEATVGLIAGELDYASARILLLDERAGLIRGVAGTGVGYNEENTRIDVSLAETGNPLVIAIQERQSVVINDPLTDERVADLPGEAKTVVGKIIVVPVFIGGKLIGLIAANRALPEADISERDERLLQAVATQAAIAIQRAQLFDQTQAALALAENLYETGQRISAAGDLQEVLAAVADSLPLPAISRMQLFIFERDRAGEIENIVVTANWHSGQGRPPQPVGTRFPRALTNRLDMLTSPAPLFFNDVEQDERVEPPVLEILRRQNVRALVTLPLWLGPRQLGDLIMEAEETHVFSEREIQPYLSLAPQVAVAVDNQRLLAETRAALAEVEATQRRYTLQAWETYLARQTSLEYEQTRSGQVPAGQALPAEVQQAVQRKQTTVTAPSTANGREGEPPNGSASSLVVPLTLRGEIIGVLGLQETDASRQWTPEEVALVEEIGEQLSLAAEALRLLDESQERAAREARLNEINEKIQSAQSLEEALQIAVREVGRTLQAPQTAVQLAVE